MKSEYQLFFCDISGAHEPIVSFSSDTPFPTLHIGQRVDDHGWNRLRDVGVIASEADPIRYCVHSLKSVIYSDQGKNIIQSWVNLAPYDGERSPAFGNTEPTMTARQLWKETSLKKLANGRASESGVGSASPRPSLAKR